ncbi:MAG: UDP-3-O-(3-hydroxymyristoyl)glucosamine N-acyltransferase [Thermodesulfobacteriota bacterium]|nr:UDP-3-O-(3-hydroxymyristoyl)glucosamine N-acyltransferase [Thermodesulfobacteriota bacterium]
MKRSLEQIARLVNGRVVGNAAMEISSAAPFEQAGAEDITLAGNAGFLKRIDQTGAGALVVPAGFTDSRRNLVAVENPAAAFARIRQLFDTACRQPVGIDPRAVIGGGFACGEGVSIGPGVVIGDHVTLGDRVVLYPGVFLGNHVRVGNDAIIHANTSILRECVLGNRVIIHAGSVIGSDGFGFAPDGEVYVKIPHSGVVQIDDDVEIGAGNAIDRATFGRTWIRQGVKTDNLVHIAHNVTVGENTIIVAQVGIAGSTTVGRHVILAGQAGISGHLDIGDNAVVGPQAGIVKSIKPGETVSGTPGMPHKLWLRAQSLVAGLPGMRKKIAELEKRLAVMEKR